MLISYADLFVFVDGEPTDRVNVSQVRSFARQAADSGRPWVVDIEHWPVDIRRHSPEAVRVTMRRLMQIIDVARQERPQVQIGFYGVGPLPDFWTPVNLDRLERQQQVNPGYDADGELRAQFQAAMRDWKRANNFLKPLAQRVDFIVPSLYTFYDSEQEWAVYARANLAEASRYGKPVVPFLWPKYHDSNPDLAGTLISGDVFRRELDLVRGLSHALVIWGGTELGIDEDAGWWKQTRAFVASLGLPDAGGPR